MILSLTSENFAHFGSLLSPGDLPVEFTGGKILRAQKSRFHGYRYPDSRVWLSGEEGRAVLAVSLDKLEFSYFFLDAPVCLNPQIYFTVVPYSDTCTAKILVSRNAQAERFIDWKRLADFPPVRYPKVSNFIFLGQYDAEESFFFKGESHRAAELLYVTDGSLHCNVSGFHWKLNKGDILLIEEDTWHSFFCNIGEKASYYSLSFVLSDADSQPLFDRIFSAPACMDEWIRDVESEMAQADAHSHGLCQSNLQKLLLLLLRMRQEQMQQELPPARERQLVSEALRYIALHCREGLSVGDVAEGIDISPSYLTALFQKCLQGSPGDYIRRMRLEESRKMIREGKQNMTQISQMLHYSTVYHFSRQFKEKYGISPTQYARIFRK